MYYFAEPLTTLFNSSDVANILRVLAIGGLFVYIQQTTTGILQGLGKTFLPLIHSSVSATFRIPLLIYVTSIPKWGLLGSAWVYVLSYFCIAVLNLMAIKRCIGLTYEVKTLVIQPMMAGLGMVVLFKLMSLVIKLSLLSSIGFSLIGLTVYFTIL